jgi:geranylgeranyl diphosphate synthase type II
MDLKVYLDEKRAMVERTLEKCFTDHKGPVSELIDAMKYSLFAGGKRLRPILCLAGAEAVGGKPEDVLPVACSLELIHTYSLIHDDLPVMDDDDLRRGKPSNHKVYGEAMALLAGDGLLTEAFHLMTDPALVERISLKAILKVIGLIAKAAGYGGMVGGQVVDIRWQEKEVDYSLLEFMHNHKTAALIAASVSSGALLGGAVDTQFKAMRAYGEKIGLAFQISDDILDIEGDPEAMGKPAGSDVDKGKVTYPSVVGLMRSREIQTGLISEAIAYLQPFDDRADALRQIARYIIERKK